MQMHVIGHPMFSNVDGVTTYIHTYILGGGDMGMRKRRSMEKQLESNSIGACLVRTGVCASVLVGLISIESLLSSV
jgi:hypothetical protein